MDQHPMDDFSGAYEADAELADDTASATRAKPDGVMDPAGEAGWFLQRDRERRGLSLDEASAATGIHPYHIQAIEYGDMTHMPPRMEALEMIAAYANFLEFDPDPLLQHYISFLPQPQIAPRHHPANPAPMTSAKILPFGRFPKLPTINFRLPTMLGGRNGIIASVAAAFIVFSGATWMMTPSAEFAMDDEQIAQSGDPMPTASTGVEAADIKITETPIASDGQVAAEESLPPLPEDFDGEQDSLGAFIEEQIKKSSDPQTVASVSSPEPGGDIAGDGRIFGANDPKARVVLKATKAIWLLIEDGKGNRVATQLLNPGDMYRVPDREGLVAIAQDGGALVYLIDGKEKGVLGVPGSLLAAEPLDVSKLEAKG